MQKPQTFKPLARTVVRQDGRITAGQPTVRTLENASIICEMISKGALTKDVCSTLKISPSVLTEWADESPEFAKMFARAKVEWCRYMAEEGLELAAANPRMITDAEGNERVDPGWVQHTTSHLNYLKWLMSKRAPKEFGDEGKTSATNINVGVSVNAISEDKRAQLMARRKSALEKAAPIVEEDTSAFYLEANSDEPSDE